MDQRRRRSPTLVADLALVATAFLFGSTFLVVQDAVALEEVDVASFLAARFAFAVVVLVPLAVRRGRPAPGLPAAGVGAGLVLAAAYLFQTIGLEDTTTSVSAFVTYLLVVFVPLISAVVLRRPPAAATLVGVVIAVVGLLLLLAGAGAQEGSDVGRGELLSLGGALAFAVHIIVLGVFVGRYDILQLNAVQCATVAVACGVPGLLGRGWNFPAEVWWAALYTGVVVTALAFGMQMYGQRRVSPSRTALVLMMEPVFAGVLGYAAGERLGAVGLLGAAVILAAIVVSEVVGTRAGDRGEQAVVESHP